jgi:cytochrome P450
VGYKQLGLTYRSRMFPTTTFGIPHYTDDDVMYKDFFIPKGTVIVMNQQKLHYDPKRWERPFEFRPERYLSYPLKAGAYTAMSDAGKRDHFSFGAGTFPFTPSSGYLIISDIS